MRSRSKAVVIKRCGKPPVIAAILRRPSPRPGHPTPSQANGGRLWPALLLLVIATFVAAVADFTQEAWPLAVLLAIPLVVMGLDACARWNKSPREIPQRTGRIVADLRPVLLRPVLVLPQGREARIVAKPPRRLIQAPSPDIRRRSRLTRRQPRLISRDRVS